MAIQLAKDANDPKWVDPALMDQLYDVPPAVLDDAIIKAHGQEVSRSSVHNVHNGKLDAAFIPTLGVRPNLLCQLDILSGYVRQVFVLTTRPTATTAQIHPSSAEVVCLDTRFHKDLLTLESSGVVARLCESSFDLPTKRNLALRISRDRGYKTAMLVDDDIVVTPDLILAGTNAITNGAVVAAAYSLSAPDVSTIDLVRSRLTGAGPRVSISGNCLFLDTLSSVGFFPYVYNEDWLFFVANILAGNRVANVAAANQLPRRDNPERRILFEQFGDVVALGLRILPTFETIPYLGADFWSYVYNEYDLSLRELHGLADPVSPGNTFVLSARRALAMFEGQDVTSFMVHYIKECFNGKRVQ